MNWALIFESRNLFVEGLWTTLQLAAISLALGFLVAVPCALAMQSQKRTVRLPARFYVYVFRGTPLIVQVYLIYFGLPQFDWIRTGPLWSFLRDPYWCALLAFTLNTGAYTAEILRGAFATTPSGEVEAATAIGMSRFKAFSRIVFPSAIRRALPQYGNEIIFLLHGTVVASVITVTDILGAGRTFNARYYTVYEGLISAALLYMVLTILISLVFMALERRFTRHLKGVE